MTPATPRPSIRLSIPYDRAQALADAISDLRCWVSGYTAGQPDPERHPLPTHHRLAEFNAELKRALDRADDRAEQVNNGDFPQQQEPSE